jgi:hypothetical protein
MAAAALIPAAATAAAAKIAATATPPPAAAMVKAGELAGGEFIMHLLLLREHMFEPASFLAAAFEILPCRGCLVTYGIRLIAVSLACAVLGACLAFSLNSFLSC